MRKSGDFIEELGGDLRRIAEIVGLEAAIKIGRAFRGTYLYIRGVDGLLRLIRDMNIRRDYDDGIDIRRLSRRYTLSERQIRNILGGCVEAVPEDIRKLLGE